MTAVYWNPAKSRYTTKSSKSENVLDKRKYAEIILLFFSLDDEGGGAHQPGSMNSSSNSSMASIAQRHSEAWERRRSSVMTARYEAPLQK